MKMPTLVTLIAAGSFSCAAQAELIDGTITADNHYALYSSIGSTFSYHGGNELGAGGAPGTYNWSEAESYSFLGGEFLYIVAWSDDSVAQGVLAEFQSASLGTILSGDPRWEVYATNVNMGDGSPHPTALDIGGHVMFADLNALWETPHVGGTNGIAPWAAIAGIDSSAAWMWKSVIGDDDPLQGGSGAGEMLIFRTEVPGPASLALLAVGGLAGRRRRRNG